MDCISNIEEKLQEILKDNNSEHASELFDELMATMQTHLSNEETSIEMLRQEDTEIEKERKALDRKKSALKRRHRKLVDASTHRQKLENKSPLPFYQQEKIDHISGMQNLGNTCFMNSVLQCFMKAQALKDYVLSPQLLKDINLVNPLGTQGHVIQAFADVVKSSSNDHFSHLSPRHFKYIVGKYRDQFQEFYQQDVAELITFLLDTMHEDTNRILKKPPFKSIELTTEDHDELSNAYYEALKKRDCSCINDLFQGQERAILQCQQCGYKTVSFTPFYTISLPVPIPVRLHKFQVIFVPHDLNESILKYALFVDMNGTAIEFKEKLIEIVNKDRIESNYLKTCHLVLADLSHSDIDHVYADTDVLRKMGNRLYAYELPHLDKQSNPVSYVSSDRKMKKMCFAKVLFQTRDYSLYTPFLIHCFDNSTNQFVINQIQHFLKRFELRELPEFYVFHQDQLLKNDDASLISSTDPIECFIVDVSGHFTSMVSTKKLRALSWDSIECHESVSVTASTNVNEQPKTLDECISMYTQAEMLGEDNMWYCPTCKTHVSALKKVDLWRTPKYLIFQLNRFQYQGYERQKLTHHIDFPVNECVVPANSTTHSYKLFAIANHYGVINAGHYTAFARDQTNEWYCFDDLNVSPIDSSKLVTSAAYILFYERT